MLTTKPFSFTADCKMLEASIKKIVSVMSVTTSPTYFLCLYKKACCVVGLSGDTFALLMVPNSTTEDTEGAFGFSPEILTGLIKGRSMLQFAFNGAECLFKQVKGKYDGKIVTLPTTVDHETSAQNFISVGKTTDTKISAEVLALIKAGLGATNVKDVYQGSSLISYVSMTAKGLLQVSSFDAQHFGLYELATGVKSREFRAALPASHFTLIDQVSGGADTQFAISSSNIKVSGKGFMLVLPATQAEDKHYNMVKNYIASMPKPVYQCGYNNNQLLNLTENLYTLYNANTEFSLIGKERGIKVSFTTTSGTASDAMQVTEVKGKEFKASVDPRLFKDILGLAKFGKGLKLTVSEKVLSITGSVENATLFLACARSE